MDASLVLIDFQNNELQFSGAYNPLTIITKESAKTLIADKFPIGNHWNEKFNQFTLQTVPLNGCEKIYLYTNGYKDQLGGDDNNKIGRKNFLSILEKSSNSDLKEQKETLEKIKKMLT